MKEFLTFALLVLAARELDSAEVTCEREENLDWYIVGSVKVCYIEKMTIIDSTGCTISPRDETIGGLIMSSNKQIRFLPERLAKTFPNLLSYAASRCELSEISKINFEDLGKLRMLYLYSNHIVKIASNTFEDLKSLEILYLENNKIKFINGEALQKLNKLTDVQLNGNVCIDEDFPNPTRIAAMAPIVTQKCGFDEPADQVTDKCLEEKKKLIEMESFMNKTIMENRICQSEMNTKMEKYEMAVKNEQDRCDSHLALFQILSDKLEKQFNETLFAKTKDLSEKTREIQNLLAELENKKEELDDKDNKIKNLKERIKLSEG